MTTESIEHVKTPSAGRGWRIATMMLVAASALGLLLGVLWLAATVQDLRAQLSASQENAQGLYEQLLDLGEEPAGEAPAEVEPGPEGARGEQGPPGDDGRQGVAGVAGAPGAPGVQGIQGVPGEAGQDGAPGQQGVPGATGPQGPAGPPGPLCPEGTTSMLVWIDTYGGDGGPAQRQQAIACVVPTATQ